jgi:CRISPR-associated endonuclease/helicase Cas3
VDLFHARYTVGDRAKIERAALARFGRRSTLEARRHRILIATQVVEQSLDVDFDVMISDLAPLDLLIQRSGRLHRHDRGSRDAPLLHVLAPDPEHVVNAAWYASMFPRAAYVYDAHGRLHRGLEAIAHGLNLASDNPRELLEAVLGTDAELHPKLQSNEDSAWARRHAERNVAIQRLLDPNAGYVLRNHFDDDDDTATRLGEETRTLCLARWDGARLMPWNHEDASDNEARAWRLSEISVKRFRAAEAVEPQDAALARAIQTVEDGWGRRGRDLIVMPLQSDGGSWVGVSRSAAGDLLRIVYDDAGLRFDPSPLWRG